jgi:hypothetical protein
VNTFEGRAALLLDAPEAETSVVDVLKGNVTIRLVANTSVVWIAKIAPAL